MDNLYEYSVKVDESEEIKIYYGVITGSHYENAVAELVDFYGGIEGEKNIINVRLEHLNTSVLEFSRDAIREMRKINDIQ